MNVVRWIIWAVVFLVILLLAFDNADMVTLKFFGLATVQLPLVLIVFIAFALGVTCGLIAGSLNVVRSRREMKKAQKELKKREKEFDKERASFPQVVEITEEQEMENVAAPIDADVIDETQTGENKSDENKPTQENA
jgi:Uncharacterized integral membrane protein